MVFHPLFQQYMQPDKEPEKQKQSIGMQTLESLYRFAIGSVAGGKQHLQH